ncbi:MAG: hypothetical protein WCK65_04645, partial [Rhodospirillaceae bacterium]
GEIEVVFAKGILWTGDEVRLRDRSKQRVPSEKLWVELLAASNWNKPPAPPNDPVPILSAVVVEKQPRLRPFVRKCHKISTNEMIDLCERFLDPSQTSTWKPLISVALEQTPLVPVGLEPTPLVAEPEPPEPTPLEPTPPEPVGFEPTPLVAESPITEAPITESPITEAPIAESPITEAPITEALITEAPITEAPIPESLQMAQPAEPEHLPAEPEHLPAEPETTSSVRVTAPLLVGLSQALVGTLDEAMVLSGTRQTRRFLLDGRPLFSPYPLAVTLIIEPMEGYRSTAFDAHPVSVETMPDPSPLENVQDNSSPQLSDQVQQAQLASIVPPTSGGHKIRSVQLPASRGLVGGLVDSVERIVGGVFGALSWLGGPQQKPSQRRSGAYPADTRVQRTAAKPGVARQDGNARASVNARKASVARQGSASFR